VLFVGDLFYEKDLAARCFAWLCQSKSQVLIGDPGRSYLPKDQLEKICEYNVPVSRDLEDAEIKRSAVWRIRNC
jgi:predicted nicotinamide N-methyase